MSSRSCEGCKLTMIGGAYDDMQLSGKCPNCNYPWRCNCQFEPDMMGQVPEGSACPFCARPRHESMMQLTDPATPEFNSLSDEADSLRVQRDEALGSFTLELKRNAEYVQHIVALNDKLVKANGDLHEARTLAAKYYVLHRDSMQAKKANLSGK